MEQKCVLHGHLITTIAFNAVSIKWSENYFQLLSIVDNCATSPCQNNGTCTRFPGGYNCTCQTEFYGKDCGISKLKQFNKFVLVNDYDSELSYLAKVSRGHLN